MAGKHSRFPLRTCTYSVQKCSKRCAIPRELFVVVLLCHSEWNDQMSGLSESARAIHPTSCIPMSSPIIPWQGLLYHAKVVAEAAIISCQRIALCCRSSATYSIYSQLT